MPDRRATSRVLGVALLSTIAGGCGDELGPERFATAHARGTIRVAGQPLTSGWVEFLPVDGTRGDLRSAPIAADGSFDADRVAVGRVAIGLVGVHGPPVPTPLGPVDLAAFRSFLTPIRRETAGPTTRLDLDLAVEAEALQRRRLERARQLGGPGG